MTKINTCSELRYRTLDEHEALFRTLQIEFGRTRARFAGAHHRAGQP
jgi:hypothetical protein